MRTIVTIEDSLYEQALKVADPAMDKADLFREAIKVFVQVQAEKRLSALGGSAPEMIEIPRPLQINHHGYQGLLRYATLR